MAAGVKLGCLVTDILPAATAAAAEAAAAVVEAATAQAATTLFITYK